MTPPSGWVSIESIGLLGQSPTVVPTRADVAVVQVGVGIDLVRIAALALFVLLALGILYVTVQNSNTSDPVYEDDEDEDSGLFNPGPAYGATGTLDVEEVLQVDGEDQSVGADEATASTPEDAPGGSVETDLDPREATEPSIDPPESGYDHVVIGEWPRGLLVTVAGEGDQDRFFISDSGTEGIPDVEPLTPGVVTTRERWALDAMTYLRETFSETSDPTTDEDAASDRTGGTGSGEFDHEVRGERSRGVLVEVENERGSAEFFVADANGPDPSVRPASFREQRHGEDWTNAASSYLRERARAGAIDADESSRETETERR